MISIRKTVVLLSGLFFVAVSVWMLNGKSFFRPQEAVSTFLEKSDTEESPAHIATTEIAHAVTEVIDSATPSLPVVSKNKTEKHIGFMGTPSEAEEVKKWLRERGSFFGEKDVEYQSYSMEMLGKLSAQGDIRAMHRLAEIYIDKEHAGLDGYGLEGADKLYWKAATLGSTEAMVKLAVSFQAQSFFQARTEAEKKGVALEVLARYNVAALRGNQYPNLVDAYSFKKTLDFKLTEEDERYIEKRSWEIYGMLAAKRSELGLKEFDNSVPASVQRFFNRYAGLRKTDSASQ